MLHLGHLPALYFALANMAGLIIIPLRGSAYLISHYGLPETISSVPETWPVWDAGHGRTSLLGMLMLVFYWRQQYDICDVMLMGAAWLGINDFVVVWKHGDRRWAWFRLVGSLAFAVAGYFGVTQHGKD